MLWTVSKDKVTVQSHWLRNSDWETVTAIKQWRQSAECVSWKEFKLDISSKLYHKELPLQSVGQPAQIEVMAEFETQPKHGYSHQNYGSSNQGIDDRMYHFLIFLNFKLYFLICMNGYFCVWWYRNIHLSNVFFFCESDMHECCPEWSECVWAENN